MGEAESVSQQEDSTGHGSRLAKRAPMMLRAALKVGNRSEVGVGRKACDAHAEEECGDSRTLASVIVW